jgi:hypothetical protein
MHALLGGSLTHLDAHQTAHLTSREYFPSVISKPFAQGLREACDFAILACLTAAAASWFRGSKFVHDAEHVLPAVESLDGELAMASDGD